MMVYNWIDGGIVGIGLVSSLMSAWRGLARELVSHTTWIAAVVIALFYLDPCAAALGPMLGIQHMAVMTMVLSFLGMVCGVMVIGGLVAHAASSVIRMIGLGWLDRLIGAGFGMARAVFLMAAFLLPFEAPMRAYFKSSWERSKLVPLVHRVSAELRPHLPVGLLDFEHKKQAAPNHRP